MSISPPDITTVEPRARVQDLHVTFQRRGVAVNALRGVSLDIRPGRSWRWSGSPAPGRV